MTLRDSGRTPAERAANEELLRHWRRKRNELVEELARVNQFIADLEESLA